MVGWVSHLPLYQKIVPNISSNHRLQVWGKLFQAFVLTETKIMIFFKSWSHLVFGTNQWYWGMFGQSPKNDSHNDNINWLSL